MAKIKKNTKAVMRVEYIIDGEVIQTLTEPPFRLKTVTLKDGSYKITEIIYFEDGAVKGTTSEAEISSDPGKSAPLLTLLTKIAGGATIVMLAVCGYLLVRFNQNRPLFRF